MRRLFLTLAAIALLGTSIGCRAVGGVCDCYSYGCYPNCYGPCASHGPHIADQGASMHHGHSPEYLQQMPNPSDGNGPAKLPSAGSGKKAM